jgi:DNA modification methylase
MRQMVLSYDADKWVPRKFHSTYGPFLDVHNTFIIVHKGGGFYYDKKSELFGVKPCGKIPNASTFNNVPHLRNLYKLRDSEGIVRIPENHVNEVLFWLMKYCPQDGVVVDPCSGAGSTLLAAMMANMRVVVNDRDARAVELSVTRAKQWLLWRMNPTQKTRLPTVRLSLFFSV